MSLVNFADGGRSSYNLTVVGTMPTWNLFDGWRFDSNDDALTVGIKARSTWSAILRYSNSTADYGECHFWSSSFTSPVFDLGGRYTATILIYRYGDKYSLQTVSDSSAGIQAMAANVCYWNGVQVSTVTGATFSADSYGNMGFKTNRTGTRVYIQAAALYARTLTPAEVWAASRQMQYCDVNPDWSAWGRRRRWFYAAATAATRPTWLGEWWGG